MRARRPAVPPADPPERRVGERERSAARRLLSAAAADGRFGSTDQLEHRLAAVGDARTRADLAAAVGDVEHLVPGDERQRVLSVLARAHAADELDYAEFLDRTDRAMPALTYDEAAALVADLGEEVVPPRQRPPGAGRARPVARRVGVPALAGGVVGAGAVVVPVALALPAEVGSWVPVALLTGAFSAAGSAAAVAALRWRRRLVAELAAAVAQPGPSPCERK
ncbi:MAG: DUF1707 SHOCT-like domain-containing protein [Acidimicrobiales bacterium]